MSEPSRYLVVDDDERFRERLVKALLKRGLEVQTAENAEEGRLKAMDHRIQRAIVDLKMSGDSGLVLTRDLLNINPDLEIVVLTAYGSIATALEAVRLGAINYLQKPATVAEILHGFARGALEPSDSPEPPVEVPSLARAEWEHISRVLTECNGSIRKASSLLGMHRRTLQRKLQKYPVSK